MKKIPKGTFDMLVELSTALEKAADELGGILDDARTFYDGQSENWQDGEAGTMYSIWMDEIDLVVEELSSAAAGITSLNHKPVI